MKMNYINIFLYLVMSTITFYSSYLLLDVENNDTTLKLRLFLVFCALLWPLVIAVSFCILLFSGFTWVATGQAWYPKDDT